MSNTILKAILRSLAALIIRRYKPEIIGITGSVGKTSTKEAIACVLGSKFRVRQNKKNYNNEIGLPLTIIDAESPGSSLLGWLAVLVKAVSLIVLPRSEYPQIIILEMGIDRPGDMDYLLRIARPAHGVVTVIGQSHIEYFGNIDRIAKEKGRLIERLSGQGWAILNYDDPRVRQMKRLSKSKVITYGFDLKADIHALELAFSFEDARKSENLVGLTFKMRYDGSVVPVHIPEALGYPVVYSALAAAAVGVTHGMNLIEVSQALFNYRTPRGRLCLVPGMKNTMLIDDTYNASPQSTLEALKVVGMIGLPKAARRWAVLGDMLELGVYTDESHLAIGQAVVRNGYDFLVAVGERSTRIMEGAIKKKMDRSRIYHFSTALEAAAFVKQQAEIGDIILIKGSQGMRMERAVKALMQEPLRAAELLVRQDWADA